MTHFWGSIDKLSKEALKVAWFGVIVGFVGLKFPELKWISWFGLATTIAGLVLKHRSEYLKKLEAAPRLFSSEQTTKILNYLENVPKQPVGILFFGQDLEAKAFAAEIKKLLETAKFPVGKLSGFMVFEINYGLSITVYNSDVTNQTALGIQKAFECAGYDMRFDLNPNKRDPMVQIAVHPKLLKQ